MAVLAMPTLREAATPEALSDLCPLPILRDAFLKRQFIAKLQSKADLLDEIIALLEASKK